MAIFRTSRMAFNCKKMDEEGVTKIVCEPLEIKGETKQKLSERPVIFIKLQNGFDLIDDGGLPKDVIKELDEYLGFFK